MTYPHGGGLSTTRHGSPGGARRTAPPPGRCQAPQGTVARAIGEPADRFVVRRGGAIVHRLTWDAAVSTVANRPGSAVHRPGPGRPVDAGGDPRNPGSRHAVRKTAAITADAFHAHY
jgi:hypothetical protein